MVESDFKLKINSRIKKNQKIFCIEEKQEKEKPEKGRRGGQHYSRSKAIKVRNIKEDPSCSLKV